ncbi:hypothetical protein [Kitasatospora griseola]|uniref:hypothetical protein n=1 Tax=Kitasatospora griseola TaxID=2064 RepID=UPI00128AF4D6|nr:hypothetical protein [Kitasatospora griseola]
MLEDVVAQVAEPGGVGGARRDHRVVVGEQRVGGGELTLPQRPVGVLGGRARVLVVVVGAAADGQQSAERAERQEGPPGGRGHRHSSVFVGAGRPPSGES